MKSFAGGALIGRLHRILLLTLLALAPALAAADAVRVPSPGSMAIEGTLNWIVGDPDPATGGRTQKYFYLQADDGRTYQLDLSAATLPDDGLYPLLYKRILVKARSLDANALRSDGGAPILEVEDARPMLVPAEPLKFGLVKAVGTQPYISLLCKFADVTFEPRTPAYFVNQYGSNSPGFDHYFRETSYNLVNLTGSTATSIWATLPFPKSYYVNGVRDANDSPTLGIGYLRMIWNDCTNAHNATVNFAPIFGMNIMLNTTLDGSAWGGCMTGTLDGVNRCWPSTWMPYYGETSAFGWRQHSILAHELSHAFGAPHSDDPAGNVYGSEWDVTSSAGASCIVNDSNYGCLGQHMNAYAKTLMSNIAAARIATHNTGTATYNIERQAQPPGAAGTHQLLRVNIAGSSTRWYTVESRFRIGYDLQLRGNGLIIHEINTARTSGNPARLVVPGGSSAAGLGGLAALWQPGMSFINAADNVRIDVNSIDANGTINVTVSQNVAVTDSWPPSCTLPSGWVKPASSLAGWSATTTSAAVGNCSLRSDPLATPPNNGTKVSAEIEYTGTMSAGNITFWAKVSSEPGYDCLRFTIDGVPQNIGSCTGGGGLGLTANAPYYVDQRITPYDTGWRFFAIPVGAGTHTVRWIYEKDYFAAGQDAAWIDQVSFPFVPVNADIHLTHTVAPAPGFTGKDVVFSMTATNNGPSPATGVAISFTYDPTANLIWVSPGCTGTGATTLTCNIGLMQPGTSTPPYKVVLRKNVAGNITNQARVSSTSTDPVPGNNAVDHNVTIGTSPAGVPVQRYRLYSPVSLEHHFTTDLNEYNTLGLYTGIWVKEGAVGKVLNNPGFFNAVQAVPYYRLYDNSTKWHHWTTDANEYYTLAQYPWWSAEGVDGYILPNAATGTTQLFRLNFKSIPTLHHWTIDAYEYSQLICCYGWAGEGGSGFVIQ